MTRQPNKEIHRLAEALAESFSSTKESVVVLTRAGMPRMQIPEDHTYPLSFWTEMLEKAADGALEEGIDPIVREALILYPGNDVFRGYLEKRGLLRVAASSLPRSPWAPFGLLVLGSLTIVISIDLPPTCSTRGPLDDASPNSEGIEATSSGSGADPERPDAIEPELLVVGTDFPPDVGSAPVRDPDRTCSSTSECEPGWTCIRPRHSLRHPIGSLTKRDDRPMTSMLLGRGCPDDRQRLGRPKTRLHGEGWCEARWHSQDERSCEVDVVVQGELFTSPRCDVFATISSGRQRTGRCSRDDETQ